MTVSVWYSLSVWNSLSAYLECNTLTVSLLTLSAVLTVIFVYSECAILTCQCVDTECVVYTVSLLTLDVQYSRFDGVVRLGAMPDVLRALENPEGERGKEVPGG